MSLIWKRRKSSFLILARAHSDACLHGYITCSHSHLISLWFITPFFGLCLKAGSSKCRSDFNKTPKKSHSKSHKAIVSILSFLICILLYPEWVDFFCLAILCPKHAHVCATKSKIHADTSPSWTSLLLCFVHKLNHRLPSPGKWIRHHNWRYLKDVQILCSGTWFRGGLGSARFTDSMTLIYTQYINDQYHRPSMSTAENPFFSPQNDMYVPWNSHF